MYKYKTSQQYTMYTENIDCFTRIKLSLINNQTKYYKYLYPQWTHYVRDIEIELLASNLDKSQEILEIGSGDGYIASLLQSKYGLNVLASDIEPRFPQYTNVLKIDGQATEFQDKKYDAIISLHVLEHIEDIDQAMKEFSRLLKDDGHMYHIVPSRATMLLTTLLQPLSYIRSIYLSFNGYFYSKYLPFKNKNILRFLKHLLTTLNPINIVWGSGHGVNSRIACFKNWSIEQWIRVFQKNNLEVIEVKHSDIAYSMHKLFPYRCMILRKILAQRGFSSSNLFIIRKKIDSFSG